MTIAIMRHPDHGINIDQIAGSYIKSTSVPALPNADGTPSISLPTVTKTTVPITKDNITLDQAWGAEIGQRLKNGWELLFVGTMAVPDMAPLMSYAWDATSKALIVVANDLAAAKEVTKTRLRAERAPLLAVNDTLFRRASEPNSATAANVTAIVAEANRLRDITKLVVSCPTVEQLAALRCAP